MSDKPSSCSDSNNIGQLSLLDVPSECSTSTDGSSASTVGLPSVHLESNIDDISSLSLVEVSSDELQGSSHSSLSTSSREIPSIVITPPEENPLDVTSPVDPGNATSFVIQQLVML